MRLLQYVTFVIITFFSIQEITAQTMSMKEAIAKAVNQNILVKENGNTIEVTREALKVARAGLFPTLGVSAGYNHQSNWGNQSSPLISGSSNSWSLGIGGDVTIFDGLSTFANITQRRSALRAAKFDLEKLKQDVILQTVSYYLAIVSNKKLLEFQTQDLQYNKSMLEKINQMYAIKSVAVTDVFSQDAQSSNSELLFLQVENNYAKAKITLLNYLAMDVAADYSFAFEPGDVLDSNLIPVDFNNLMEIALANRQDFKSADAKVIASESQLKSSQGANYPQVTGSYNLSTSASDAQNLFDQKSFSIGVNASYSIFSRFNIEYAIVAADIQLKNSREDLTAVERQIKVDVKNTSLEMQTARKEFDVAKKAQASYEQSWKAKKETYTLGAAPYLDLQLSYNNYLQSEYTVISKEYAYIYAQFQLLAAVGKLQK